MKLTKEYLKKLIREAIQDEMEDDEEYNPRNLKDEWKVGTELMVVAPSDGEQPSVTKIEAGNPFRTKLGAYDAYIAKVKVVEVVTASEEQ